MLITGVRKTINLAAKARLREALWRAKHEGTKNANMYSG